MQVGWETRSPDEEVLTAGGNVDSYICRASRTRLRFYSAGSVKLAAKIGKLAEQAEIYSAESVKYGYGRFAHFIIITSIHFIVSINGCLVSLSWLYYSSEKEIKDIYYSISS